MQWREGEFTRNALFHELNRKLNAARWIFAAHEVEIAVAFAGFDHFAGVDVMGIFDDKPGRILAKNGFKLYGWHYSGSDEIPKYASWAYTRELIGISHPDYCCARGNCREKLRGELYVNHRGFVENKDVCLVDIFRVKGEAVGDGIPLEKPVNRLCFCAYSLAHALCRAPCGGCEDNIERAYLENVHERADNRGLAYAGASCDDRKFARKAVLKRCLLACSEGKA